MTHGPHENGGATSRASCISRADAPQVRSGTATIANAMATKRNARSGALTAPPTRSNPSSATLPYGVEGSVISGLVFLSGDRNARFSTGASPFLTVITSPVPNLGGDPASASPSALSADARSRYAGGINSTVVATNSAPSAAVMSSKTLTVFVSAYARPSTQSDMIPHSRLAANERSVTLWLAYARSSAVFRMVNDTMMWKKKSAFPSRREALNGRTSSRNPGAASPKRAYMIAAVP